MSRHILHLILLLLFTTANPKLIAQTIQVWEGVRGHHARVTLSRFAAQAAYGDALAQKLKRKGISVIVCPGGSYFWHDMLHEGTEVGEWLSRNGIEAYVLRYRTAYVPAFLTGFRWIFRGHRYPDAQEDLRRSLRIIRDSASVWNVHANRIGVMGFSAGGHLAMSSAELFPKEEWPAFIVPVYPVVTMTKSCVHKRSRRALLGDNRKHNRRLRDSLSLERHVPNGSPPVLLVNCKDDPIVHFRNSELLDSALTSKNIPHVYIQYKTGGHGFGASDKKGSAESRTWKEEFIKWISNIYQ